TTRAAGAWGRIVVSFFGLPLTLPGIRVTSQRLAGLRRKGGEMERTGRAEKIFDWGWFLAWAVASSAWCLTAPGQLSARCGEPSLLAHASLVTTDIAVTACVLALVYHYRMGRGAGWFGRIGLPTFWYAVAILAKASGLVFGPICLLVVELSLVVGSPWDLVRH